MNRYKIARVVQCIHFGPSIRWRGLNETHLISIKFIRTCLVCRSVGCFHCSRQFDRWKFGEITFDYTMRFSL